MGYGVYVSSISLLALLVGSYVAGFYTEKKLLNSKYGNYTSPAAMASATTPAGTPAPITPATPLASAVPIVTTAASTVAPTATTAPSTV